jgi:hypothetical protein
VLTWEFHENGISVRAEGLRGEYAWNWVKSVQKAGQLWLLELVNGHVIVVPIDQLTDGLRELIETKVEDR